MVRAAIAAVGSALLIFSAMMFSNGITHRSPPTSATLIAWVNRLLRLAIPLAGLAGGAALLRDAALQGELTAAISAPPVAAPER